MVELPIFSVSLIGISAVEDIISVGTTIFIWSLSIYTGTLLDSFCAAFIASCFELTNSVCCETKLALPL